MNNIPALRSDKNDRYYIDELLAFSDPPKIASQGRIYDLDPIPCRIMRIMDRFNPKTPVHTVNITQSCEPASYILDRCIMLNDEYEAYQKIVLEYVNSQ